MPLCHLVAREINIRWWHLISNFIIYIVQLYKEDCTFCRYVWLSGIALLSTEQIIGMSGHDKENHLFLSSLFHTHGGR